MGDWEDSSNVKRKDPLEKCADDVQAVLQCVSRLKQLHNELGSGRNDRSVRKQMAQVRSDATERCRRVKQTLQTRPASQDKARHEKISSQFNVVLRDFEKVSNDSLMKEKQLYQDQALGQSAPENDGLQLMAQAQQASISGAELQVAEEQQNEIRQLEADLIALNDCFIDMKSLVEVQQDTINTIEDNISRVVVNVQEANQELTKASTYQKSSRKKMCCLMILFLLIGIVILVVFVAK
eukprot:TRINITY_DN14413_c0_g1_i1.p1 TRINITY_DN14413_c0_g1~~TRINITY_DN14413_c0_g1_i1.p1  ORF type:complete len:238 (+),score=57.95 TRINITY_DN14413_c0_g1_i1:44-757(+)